MSPRGDIFDIIDTRGVTVQSQTICNEGYHPSSVTALGRALPTDMSRGRAQVQSKCVIHQQQQITAAGSIIVTLNLARVPSGRL